ncbi:MAG: hypothetical protein KDK36_14140 [Leptospiraceae bacterium]|nr:hypothetical protein [Leptospiraceae bacterium]
MYKYAILILFLFNCKQESLLFKKFNKGSNLISHSEIGFSISYKDCKECHEKEYNTWKESAHANSFSNPLFQIAYSLEHREWCRNCHAPLFNPKLEDRNELNKYAKEEGINCAVCHIRQGKIVSKLEEPSKNKEHQYIKNLEISKSEVCANCHEFPFPKEHHPNFSYGTAPMQSTYSEYLQTDYPKKDKKCQSCHFKKEDHNPISIMRDLPELLKVQFSTKPSFDNASYNLNVNIKIEKIGHNFPTGDLFRTLSIYAYNDKKDLLWQKDFSKSVNLKNRETIFDNRIKNSGKGIKKEITQKLFQKPVTCKVIYRLQEPIEAHIQKFLPEEKYKVIVYSGECN